jgi:hypothetical protein
MSYGIQVKGPAGNETVNLTMSGGRSYVQEIRRTWESPGGQTYTYTFPNIPGGENLVVYVAQNGPFYWTTSTVNNQAVISLYAQPESRPPGYGSYSDQSVLSVFTRKTTETFNNDYGVALVNDAGERIVSAIYSTAEFIGKLTFSPVVDQWINGGIQDLPRSSYHLNIHTSEATNIGAGRKRIILWNLPETSSTDVWYTCDSSYLPDTLTGNFQIQMKAVTKGGLGYAMPEAYVFAVDGINPSSDSYGLRIYDASGRVTFDAGLNHMVISGFYNGMDFNIDDIVNRYNENDFRPQVRPQDPSGPTNTYTINGFDGIVPLIFLPTLFVEEGIPYPGTFVLTYYLLYYTGMVRKTGNQLSMRGITTGFNQEDAALANGWWWESGSVYDHGTVIVDATPLGGAAIPSAYLMVTKDNTYITSDYQLNVTWECTGASTLSWYLEGVYQGELPMSGSAALGPFAPKQYSYWPYTIAVVAKDAGGRGIATSTIQWYVV